MKNLILLGAFIFAVFVLSAQENQLSKKEKKAARKAEQIKMVKALIESNTWQFDANQMLPASGRSKTLTTNYSVSIKDKSIDSYLPFYGRAYSADYGSNQSPLIFESTIKELTVEDAKKGGWLIKCDTKNKNDALVYSFAIAENGSATLHINSTNRQHISFHGDVVEIEEEKEK